VRFAVTRPPSDAWVAQQLLEATPFRQARRFLIRDRDSKYGAAFTRVIAGTSIKVLKTPYRAPKANAICEPFLGSVRRRASVPRPHPGFRGATLLAGDSGIRGVLQSCASTSRNRTENT
jgi:hypothetical protein